MFTPLSRNDITEIVRLQLAQVLKRVNSTDLKIEITDAAVNRLAEEGFVPHFGARPVKRIIQRHVLNELSRKILAGTVRKDRTIVIDADDNSLVFIN
jgi:ATP-dependent Clp protease ATP-binding subunit ClpB